jgi:hypothetical protein
MADLTLQWNTGPSHCQDVWCIVPTVRAADKMQTRYRSSTIKDVIVGPD